MVMWNLRFCLWQHTQEEGFEPLVTLSCLTVISNSQAFNSSHFKVS